MAQVPDYTAAPTQNLTTQGTPTVHEDTPEAAFGVNVSRAIQGLGQTVSSSGNELFGRAVALKQLDNETEARDADTNYMIEVGKRHADFSALEGKQRADALPAYMQGLQDLRKQYRGNLSNDASRRMFDANSLSTMGRTIFNGAGQAASGLREYSNKSIDANLNLIAKTVEDNPGDEGALQDALRRGEEAGRQKAGLQYGAPTDGPIADNEVMKAQSKMLRGRIDGLTTQGKIDAASDFIDKYHAKMTADDLRAVTEHVKTQDRAIGASVISNDIYDSKGAAQFDKPAATLKEMEDEARTQAEKRRPGDSIFADHAVKAMQSRYYVARNAERQDKLQLDQSVAEFVRDNQPVDLQDFLVKGGNDFYNRMRPTDQLALPGQIAKYNKQQNQETNWAEYQRLRGMADNPQRAEDFLNQDPADWKVDKSQWSQLMNVRRQLIKSGVTDPHVSKAYGWLQNQYGPTMRELNLIGPNQDKEEHDKLWGAISDSIEAWRDTKKVQPSYQDFMEKIAPQLMKEIHTPHFFGLYNSTDRGFQIPVPQQLKEQIITEYKRAGKPEPDDVEIQHFYNRGLFKNLFEGMKTQDKLNGG